MIPLVIYHANCADGFTAAWACHKKNPDWEYVPVAHGEEFDLYKGAFRDVYFLDFTFKRAQILELSMIAKNIYIIDHHKSAAEDLAGIGLEAATVGGNPVMLHMDMDKSGARLAWEFFHPGEEPSPILLRVEDRDLWRFAYDDTEHVTAAIFSYEFTFENWDNLMRQHPSVPAADGLAITRYNKKNLSSMLRENARTAVIYGKVIPVANMPYMYASEAGHRLSKGQPFSATYYDSATERHWSLRSDKDNDGFDVSKVAVLYGGGGHKHAAGFKTPLDWMGDLAPVAVEDL